MGIPYTVTLKVAYENERAIDLGGVTRDMLSGFWIEAYKCYFDRCTPLTPVIHQHAALQVLPTIDFFYHLVNLNVD